MERDTPRLAWKTSPLGHMLGFALLALAGLAILLGLALVHAVVDAATGGAVPQALLRIAITLPESLWSKPVVLFDGFPVSPGAFMPVVVTGLFFLPILVGLLLAALDGTVVRIGSQVIARIRTTVLDAVLNAPSAALDEVSTLTTLAARALARENSILGASLLVSLKLGGLIGLACVYVLATDWTLGVALTLALALAAILNARRFTLRLGAAKARQVEGEVAQAVLTELEHRIPALRAHGMGPYERERVRQALAESHRPVAAREGRLALVDSASAALAMIAPLTVLAIAIWSSDTNRLTAGEIASCLLATAMAAHGVREFAQWHRFSARGRALLVDIAQNLAALKSRDQRQATGAALPASGALVAQGASAYDPTSGARVSGVSLSLAFPSHVALIGDGDSGPRLLAALMGGQIAPSTGRLTYGGIDLAAADATERSQRIAFAGETVLIEGSLKDNLLYGYSGPQDETAHRLTDAIAVAGLDRLTHARGLSGTINPKREPKLAEAIVESRRAVREALVREELDRFVDPFQAERYNRYATIGENLLFGKAIGDTFREDRLSSHPFVRAILEAEDLTRPLVRIGLTIATSMIEIFAEIPDGHPLFERFSFFAASDRSYFQDLVERQNERRRGVQVSRDQERLIGVALRYNESRHRLGLLDEALEARLLAARADFARMLPVSLKPAIEFYDQHRLCTAASIQDNLLFGRIAADQAGAADAVHNLIRRVLTERGLDGEVSRIGLEMPVDAAGTDLTSSEIAAIDLVRCLVRRPNVLVVQRALDGLPGASADRLVMNLRRALVGRGLILVTPSLSPAMDQPPFDAVIRFERGEPVIDHRIRQPEALSA